MNKHYTNEAIGNIRLSWPTVFLKESSYTYMKTSDRIVFELMNSIRNLVKFTQRNTHPKVIVCGFWVKLDTTSLHRKFVTFFKQFFLGQKKITWNFFSFLLFIWTSSVVCYFTEQMVDFLLWSYASLQTHWKESIFFGGTCNWVVS